MISTEPNMLLYVEPIGTENEPVIDELTKRMTAAFRLGVSDNANWRGKHDCTGKPCWHDNANYVESTNCDYILPNGMQTNSLCIHYLAFHRNEISESELAKVRSLPYGEADPTEQDIYPPGSSQKWRELAWEEVKQNLR